MNDKAGEMLPNVMISPCNNAMTILIFFELYFMRIMKKVF